MTTLNAIPMVDLRDLQERAEIAVASFRLGSFTADELRRCLTQECGWSEIDVDAVVAQRARASA